MYGSLLKGRRGQRLHLTGSQALAASTILINLTRIVSTMCLSRLLSPAVYGITGLIISIFYVITMLTDVGFQAYVVRHDRSDEPEFMNAVWTIHATRGIALTVVAILLAWPLSAVLDKPQLAAPLAVAGFTFLIDGQASLGQFRALRENRVQRFALMDLITTIGQIVAAIILAVFIRSIWAIVISMLVGSCIRVSVSYTLFPGNRRRLRADRGVAGDLWRFSRMIALSSALTLVISQVDKLAMSRIMPLSQFGTYVIAATLASAPIAFAYSYSEGIVFPAVASAFREGGPIGDVYYRCWGRFFYLYALGGGCLVGGADLLIRLLYDPRYYGASLYLSILAIATAMSMWARAMNETLVASGQTHVAVELNLVRIVWLLVGGALALAGRDPLTFVATIGLMEVPAYFYAAWKLWRVNVIRWGRELSIVATITAGMGAGFAASYLGRLLFPNL